MWLAASVQASANKSSLISQRRSAASSSQAWAALTENQQFVSDVWFAVTAQYFDPTFNGMNEDGWRAKKSEAVSAVSDLGPEDESEVEGAIQKMLASLDDPYTRFLSREITCPAKL